MVTNEFDFNHVTEAFEALLNNEGDMLKVMVKFDA
jgi:hypothetical protein